MKTTAQRNGNKKTAATLFSLLIFVNSVLPQPLSERSDRDYVTAIKRLDMMATSTEQSIKYIAPANATAKNENTLSGEDITLTEKNAIERLNNIADLTEETVKYVAPDAEKTEIVSALNRMDKLASREEISAKYVAPKPVEINDKNNFSAEDAISRLDYLADATEKSIQYKTTETVTASEDVNNAIARLDKLASHTESALIFKSPAAENTYTDVICESYKERAALERLDEYTASTEKTLQFKSPKTDELQQNSVCTTNDIPLVEKILDENKTAVTKTNSSYRTKYDHALWSWLKENVLDELKTGNNNTAFPLVSYPDSRKASTPSYQNTSY